MSKLASWIQNHQRSMGKAYLTVLAKLNALQPDRWGMLVGAWSLCIQALTYALLLSISDTALTAIEVILIVQLGLTIPVRVLKTTYRTSRR